ncbi:unnamed protein product [Amoebophrya sp. A120]|nr:unnamed protein product [Amoebophrya sp. A120]|eukprot:GSA120T00009195001.1
MALTPSEIGKHNKQADCWVIIGDDVYDVTNWLPNHPGGVKPIMNYAGQDATEEFDMLHEREVIKKVGIKKGFVKHLGKLQK